MRAYNVMIPSIGNSGRIVEAGDLFVKLLGELGCKLPKRGWLLHVLGGLIGIKSYIKTSVEDFVSCMELVDEEQIQAMCLLSNLATSLYMPEGSLLHPLRIPKNFRLNIPYGLSENGMLLHSRMLPTSCCKPLLDGSASGMAFGDVESAMWCFCYLTYSDNLGRGLKVLGQDFAIYSKQMKAYNQLLQVLSLHFSMSCGKWFITCLAIPKLPNLLPGDRFDALRTEATAQRHLTVMMRFWQTNLAYLMCDDEVGAEFSHGLKKDFFSVDALFPACFGYDILEAHIAILSHGATRKLKCKKCVSTGKNPTSGQRTCQREETRTIFSSNT
eukprot:scaffold41387_cov176-Amphora_coffeaeformis.AAC.2